MIVVLDPGHGGADAGCTALHGAWQEKRFTLDVARLARDACYALSGELEPVLTRDTDTGVPLSVRARIAREAKADLVISIHANAFGDTSARGAMAFWLATDARAYAEEIARHIPDELRRKRGSVFRATEQDWPRVVNVLHYHDAPAVLLECGFSTNPHDLDSLRDPLAQQGLANAIAKTARYALLTKETESVNQPANRPRY